MFMNAVDVLEWGRNQWPDVSKDDRGAIFEKSFIRGAKSMFLEAMHEVRIFTSTIPSETYSQSI
jgi:stress-induced-phosphoprotein 1